MKLRSFLILLLVFFLVLVIGSLGDEPLTPETAAVLYREPAKASSRKNAFVGLVGFHAEESKDFLVEGRAYLKELITNWDMAEYPTGLDVKDSYQNPCFDSGEEACLAKLANDKELIRGLLEENRELVRRYEIILAMPLYVNTGSALDFAPHYDGVGKISNLLSAAAFLEIGQGNINGGLNFIERDMNFYKRIFTGKDVKIGDLMLASRRIGEYALGVSKLIQDQSVDLGFYGDTLNRILEPVSEPERYIANAIVTENMYNIKMFSTLSFDPSDFGSPRGFSESISFAIHKVVLCLFFKKRMTLNSMNELMEEANEEIRTTRMLHLPERMAEEPAKRNRAGDESFLSSVSFLYRQNGLFFWKNCVGESVLKSGRPDFMDYLARACDVTVFLHLVRAQLDLSLLKKEPESFVQAMAGLGPECLNPYTEASFNRDVEKNTLWFERAYKWEKDRMEVMLPPSFKNLDPSDNPAVNVNDLEGGR